MIVSEFYQDAKTAFEGCSEELVLRRLTEAVEMLSNEGILDVNLAQMTLCLCNGTATLPRDVGTVLGLNTEDHPTLLQDQWFQYHINGPGSRDCPACDVSYELGQFCTYKDPSKPCYLIAKVSSAADNNKKLRVFAIDENGHKIFTPGPDGKLYEGFLVPMQFNYSPRNPGVPALNSIYRIERDQTKDYVQLIAVNKDDGVSQTQIGYYEPSETVPTYRRIRVPNKSYVRIKYKKRNLELQGQRDWINCDNRQALYLACRAVKFNRDDKYIAANSAIAQAVELINRQAEAQRPAGPKMPQIINGVWHDNDDNLFGYGGCGGGWSGGLGNSGNT